MLTNLTQPPAQQATTTLPEQYRDNAAEPLLSTINTHIGRAQQQLAMQLGMSVSYLPNVVAISEKFGSGDPVQARAALADLLSSKLPQSTRESLADAVWGLITNVGGVNLIANCTNDGWRFVAPDSLFSSN